MASDHPENDARKVWQDQSVAPIPMNINEIRKKARKFQKRIWWRNLSEYAAAVFVVAGFGFYLWRFDGLWLRTGSLLIIAATLYMVYQLHKRGSSESVPTGASSIVFHRTELERQRDALQSVWRWYLLPFVPGMIIFLIGRAIENPPGSWAPLNVTVLLCVAVFFLVGKLNQRAARKLQHQIDELAELQRNG